VGKEIIACYLSLEKIRPHSYSQYTMKHSRICTKIFEAFSIFLIDAFAVDPMAKVQHYRGLDTDLESLYISIRAEIANENNLQIVSEYKGDMNGKPLRSIVAVNKSL
jgi:hypothetical protein